MIVTVADTPGFGNNADSDAQILGKILSLLD